VKEEKRDGKPSTFPSLFVTRKEEKNHRVERGRKTRRERGREKDKSAKGTTERKEGEEEKERSLYGPKKTN